MSGASAPHELLLVLTRLWKGGTKIPTFQITKLRLRHLSGFPMHLLFRMLFTYLAKFTMTPTSD